MLYLQLIPCFNSKPIYTSGEDDYLAWPSLSGTLLKAPYDKVSCLVNIEDDYYARSGKGQNGEYPGIFGAQFGVLYDDSADGNVDGLGGGNGLYLATYDSDGYRKDSIMLVRKMPH